MGPSLSKSLLEVFANLTDVSLADEVKNSVLTDDVNGTIIGNVAMQVAPPSGQTCNYLVPSGGQSLNQCKVGPIWWLNS